MLNRSLSTQLLLITVALFVWLLYLGSRYMARHDPGQRRAVPMIFYTLLTSYALGHILFVGYAWLNRVTFPLNLETMELLKLQHVKRLLAGLPLYVEPSATFIPLVYNPLYYYLVLPFTWILGVNLTALRVASIVGACGAYVLVFLAVQQGVRAGNALLVADAPSDTSTPRRWPGIQRARRPVTSCLGRSAWWGVIAVGLMAAAFRVMDTYLDNAAADSWTLFVILLGTYLIGLNRSLLFNILGIASLVIAFWLKQYGAIFTVGAVLYLTWRDGWQRAWLYWAVAAIGGPILYFFVPSAWFGSEFHYYTWAVPKQWAYFSLNSTILRVVKFVVKYYGWLAIAGGLLWLWLVRWHRQALSIWHFMLPFALLSGPYVALDPGNNNNVFIPLGTWLIITGVIGVKFYIDRVPTALRWGIPLLIFSASFALFSYNPMTILVPRNAELSYRELVATVEQLDGPVYAPGLGQAQDRELFYPTVHWVTIIDLIRYPGADLCDQPLVHELLDPVVHPTGPAYILMEHPLEEDAMLSFLTNLYVLDTDFGDRYIALRDSPKLLEVGWPTYLYRYEPMANTQVPWVCG